MSILGLIHKLTLALSLFALGETGIAADFKPGSKPFLVVEGAVKSGHPGPDGRLRKVFSESEVLAMPTTVITTETSWRPTSNFVGPSLKSVLLAAGVEISPTIRIEMFALNEYAVSIPVADLSKYNPVLTHTVDGKRLLRRDYGPLWLMYPRSDFEELRNNATTDGKLIWQAYRIVVH